MIAEPKQESRKPLRGLAIMASKIKEPVITLSAGPVAAYPRVLRAMSRPVQYDFDPWFQQFYEDVDPEMRQGARAPRTPR